MNFLLTCPAIIRLNSKSSTRYLVPDLAPLFLAAVGYTEGRALWLI